MLGNIELSGSHRRKIKSRLKKSLRILKSFVLPLLAKKGLISLLGVNKYSNTESHPSWSNNENIRITAQMKSLGRDLIPRPFPYQVSLSYQDRNSLQGSVFHNNENELDSAKNIEQLLNDDFWNRFKDYLLTTHREKSIRCRLAYSKKYYHVLLEGNAQDILSLSDQKRLQVMKSLASLSKFMGCYDKWKSIKEKYQLK